MLTSLFAPVQYSAAHSNHYLALSTCKTHGWMIPEHLDVSKHLGDVQGRIFHADVEYLITSHVRILISVASPKVFES